MNVLRRMRQLLRGRESQANPVLGRGIGIAFSEGRTIDEEGEFFREAWRQEAKRRAEEPDEQAIERLTDQFRRMRAVQRVEMSEALARPTPKKQTPRVQTIVARAERMAHTYGDDFIGTEHLLLALAEEEHGIAPSVLDDLGVRTKIKERLKAVLESEDYNREGRRGT